MFRNRRTMRDFFRRTAAVSRLAVRMRDHMAMKNRLAWISLLGAVLLLRADAPSAQNAPARFNRMIEKFAQGKSAFGTLTNDRSLEMAQTISRSDLDWVLIDMEHGSMDVQQLRMFLVGMTDVG